MYFFTESKFSKMIQMKSVYFNTDVLFYGDLSIQSRASSLKWN